MTTLSKTELIDQAIKDLDGLAQHKGDYYWIGQYTNYGVKFTLFYQTDDNNICSLEEFEQRKKELEQMNNSWYDYDKQTAVGKPPIGEIVLYNDAEKGLIQVEIIGHHPHYQDVVWSEAVDKGFSGGFDYSTDGNYLFHPLDWDKLSKKKKLVDQVSTLIYQSGGCQFNVKCAVEKLYELGYLKLPENKA